MSASHFNLGNLTAILDNNNLQQTGSNNEIMSLSLDSKWSSFGWEVINIDGHNINKFMKRINLKLKNQN